MPAYETARAVSAIFISLLELEAAGDGGFADGGAWDTDFWQLGGTSLAMIRLCVEVEKRLDTSITIATVIRHPTARALAQEIDRLRGQRPVSAMAS